MNNIKKDKYRLRYRFHRTVVKLPVASVTTLSDEFLDRQPCVFMVFIHRPRIIYSFSLEYTSVP